MSSERITPSFLEKQKNSSKVSPVQLLQGWRNSVLFVFRNDILCISGWWFQICFIFNPTWGNTPILTNIFHVGWNHQPDIIIGSHVANWSFALELFLKKQIIFFSGHFFCSPFWLQVLKSGLQVPLRKRNCFFFNGGEIGSEGTKHLWGEGKNPNFVVFLFFLLLLQEIVFQNVTGFIMSLSFLLCWLEMMLPFFLLCWRFIRTITQRIKIFFRSESLVQLAWRLILYPWLGHRMHSSWFCCFSVQHKRPYWGQTRVSNRLWIMNTESIDSRNGKDFEVLEPSLRKYIDPLLKCK